MSDTVNGRCFYSEYKPTRRERFWRWAGFRRAHTEAPNSFEEIEGFAPGSITTNVVCHVGWLDRFRLLLTGMAEVQIRTMTNVTVDRAVSVSAMSILSPGDHKP